MDTAAAPTPGDPARRGRRILEVFDRRAGLVDTVLVLLAAALGCIALGYLSSSFQDYSHLILMFCFAWLLAFLISPVADFLQRRLHRLPRALAVIAPAPAA